MARARNMQALTYDLHALWPGVTVWGKGDRAHQGSASDHNEDDTAGSRPEQHDDDDDPEHRAIDVPLLGPVTMAKLRELRPRLTDRPHNARRLRYVILENKIWRKRNGWREERYFGGFHNHLHVSGDAADDENGDRFDIGPDERPAAAEPEGDDDMKILAARYKDAKGTRSTVWTGLRHTWPLTAESNEETVSALTLAGAVPCVFESAEALVSATGPMPGKTVAESVAAVKAAG